MEILSKIIDIVGKIIFFFVILWAVGYRIFERLWDKISTGRK
jgi:uncharacterized membrane protein